MLLKVLCLVLCIYGLPVVTGTILDYKCYPNATFIVVNPNATIFTHVVAFEELESNSNSPCNATLLGSVVTITECHMNRAVIVHFSDRHANAPHDMIVGGHHTKSFRIECREITPFTKIVSTILHVLTTTQSTTTSTVTPTPTEPTTTTTEPTTTTIEPAEESPVPFELQNVSEETVHESPSGTDASTQVPGGWFVGTSSAQWPTRG